MSVPAADRSARRLFVYAMQEAVRHGSPSVEAEHLLLAVAAEGPRSVRTLVEEFGLGYEAVEALVTREREASLGGVGVEAKAPMPLRAMRGARGRDRLGASAVSAFRRARFAAHGPGRRNEAVAILLGVLDADYGTVPRMLAFAGVDRAALRARLEAL